MKNSFIAFPLLATVVFVAPATGFDDRDSNGLSIVIVTDKDKSGSSIIDAGGKFQVVFTNQSKKPIHLWSESCQLGYENLFFQIEDDNGLRSLMRKSAHHPISRRYNLPKTVAIPPGRTFLWEAKPSAIWRDETWIGVPEPNTGKQVSITAIFEIRSSDATKEHGVWTGRLASQPTKLLLVDAKLHTPHEYLWANCPKQALKIIQADRTWISKIDENNHTPLHLAARFGFVEVARWLLTHGADVNARAYNEFTPLL